MSYDDVMQALRNDTEIKYIKTRAWAIDGIVVHRDECPCPNEWRLHSRQHIQKLNVRLCVYIFEKRV
jgi:hypothetical protein